MNVVYSSPEFLEFFGLNATASEGSPILTASASPTATDNDNAAKVNDEEMDDSPASVGKNNIYFFVSF